MKKISGLTVKFVLGFVLVAIMLCATIVMLGGWGEWENMAQQYYDMAYLIADSVESEMLEEMTPEELMEYANAAKSGDQAAIEEITGSESYKLVSGSMDDLRRNMKLTDIYVTIYSAEDLRAYKKGDESWKPLVYIFDNYINADEVYPMGERSSMNPDNIELFAEVVETGKPQDDYIISNGDFGYNMSALKPVMTEDGKVAAVIGVEVPMTRINYAVQTFVTHTLIPVVALTIAIFLIFILVLYKGIVVPVDIISREVMRFGETGARTDESIKNLSSIKTKDEMQALAGQIDKMEVDTLNYVENITKITAEKERISAELNVATEIQASQLPSIFPAFPDRTEFDLYASMDPAKEVGGDFYDFFMKDSDHLALVIADVSGKGVPAALFMMISMVLIRTRAQTDNETHEILENVNNQLCQTNEPGMFVTVWLAIINLKTGHVVETNGGHEYPALKRKDGDFELIVTSNSPAVAVMEDMPYTQREYDLMPGDRLFVYTDGVPEATNSKDELFGTDRMMEALNKYKDCNNMDLLRNVRKSVDEFVGEAPQFDDLTMLAFTYNGSGDTQE